MAFLRNSVNSSFLIAAHSEVIVAQAHIPDKGNTNVQGEWE